MANKTIKTIAFDIGGVLQSTKYSKPVRGHEVLGVHQEVAKRLRVDLDSWFDAIDTVYAKSFTGEMKRKKALATIAHNLEIPQAKLIKIIVSAYRHHFKRNSELYSIVKKLRAHGYKTIILSDQWYLSSEALIPRADRRLFNQAIISCEVGLRKPSREIYKLLIKRARVPPREIIFIDNRKWNTIPASKLGIQTILYKNNRQTIRELKKLGVEVK